MGCPYCSSLRLAVNGRCPECGRLPQVEQTPAPARPFRAPPVSPSRAYRVSPAPAAVATVLTPVADEEDEEPAETEPMYTFGSPTEVKRCERAGCGGISVRLLTEPPIGECTWCRRALTA